MTGLSEAMFSQSRVVATGQDGAVCLISCALLVPLYEIRLSRHQGLTARPHIRRIPTYNLAFWRRLGGSLLARISRRSK